MGEQKRKAVAQGRELFASYSKEELDAAARDAERLAQEVMILLGQRNVAWQAGGLTPSMIAARMMMVLPSVVGYVAAGIAVAHGNDMQFLGNNWLSLQAETNRQFRAAMAQAAAFAGPKH